MDAWYLAVGTGSACALGPVSWDSALAPLCSPVGSFSLRDAVAVSESHGVMQLSTAHVSVVCQTR